MAFLNERQRSTTPLTAARQFLSELRLPKKLTNAIFYKKSATGEKIKNSSKKDRKTLDLKENG